MKNYLGLIQIYRRSTVGAGEENLTLIGVQLTAALSALQEILRQGIGHAGDYSRKAAGIPESASMPAWDSLMDFASFLNGSLEIPGMGG